MTRTEKIIIGSTAIVSISAITMVLLSNKYERTAKEVATNLKDVHYVLSKSREDIIIGNKEIAEGNKILRTIVKKSSEENVN
jgi:hypothetical protein